MPDEEENQQEAPEPQPTESHLDTELFETVFEGSEPSPDAQQRDHNSIET